MDISGHTTTTSGRVSLSVRELFDVFTALGVSDVPLIELEFADIEKILTSLTPEAIQSAGSLGMTIKVPVSVALLSGLPTPVKQQVLVPFLMAVRSGNVSNLVVTSPPPTPATSPGPNGTPPASAEPGKVLMFAAKTPKHQTLTPKG